ncbi:hypothetical protein JKG68_31760 [Microvirga aerilata]|uniref:Uncharacterized protein n=1 Tax=Microvirga aerilata TaxID=670292 RepID=A0A936ZIQ9_9HYPH|nr:hypothetical protein [Microvirga aerilata]MBL0408445.1 hypothetical protein [Microvirga aerilata]
MPGIARQFEPQITRTGGASSRYRFTTRCSTCHKADTYEASKPVGDELVKAYFKDRGWLLGRGRSYDLCPACLVKPREPQQRHTLPTSAHRLDRSTASAAKQPRDTADILARHLGKPEALAAEVFRIKPAQSPRPSTPDAPQQAAFAPALPREVEQALTGMAADLKSLRSTMELMAEQISNLVALGSQQIEAISRLAPLVVQSAEGISGGLRDVVSAIQTIPSSSSPTGEPTKAEEPLMREADPVGPQDPEINREPEPVMVSKVQKRLKQGRRPEQAKDQTRKMGSVPVSVKSIPDAKRSDRFYTSIRLPRELWDQAGFGPEDRLLLDWSGKALTIERIAEGGVKPKSISEASVVLQSWKLGNLNLDQPKLTGAHASLRLTAGRISRRA